VEEEEEERAEEEEKKRETDGRDKVEAKCFIIVMLI
jgi:hypothetical protein